MDDIWENIHLISSLHRPIAAVPTTATATTAAYHLPDFLSIPLFTKLNPLPPPPLNKNTGAGGGSISPATTSNITTLNLGGKNKSKSKSKSASSSNYTYFEHKKLKLVPCSICSNGYNNKLPTEDKQIHADADGRFKKMIKNRETAARTRDRKHAYTYELEVELARLKKENAMLRKQHYMLHLPPPPTQLPKKPTLYRTLTAPF